MAERAPLFHARGPLHSHSHGSRGGGGRGSGGGRGGGPSSYHHGATYRGGRGSPYGGGQQRHHHQHHHGGGRSSPYGPSSSKAFFGGGGGGGRGGGPLPLSSQQQQSPPQAQPHPCERYVSEPMLCGYLWKQKVGKKAQEQQQQQAEGGGGGGGADESTNTNSNNNETNSENPQDDNPPTKEEEEKEETLTNQEEENTIKREQISPSNDNDAMKDDDDAETKKKQALEKQYTAYRRQYCETYLKHVFNAHLDDSWFRQLYSPLARVQAAEWEQQRAQTEARFVWDEIREWQPNPLKNVTLRTTLSLTTELDSPRAIPRFHIPRAVRDGRLLQVQKVPPHVTHTQLWHALPPASRWIQHAAEGEDSNNKNSNKNNNNPAPDSVLQLISSIPSQTHHTRTVYWLCPNKATADALWQAFLSLDGRPTATADSTITTVPWEVDCPDPYRRTEYDVDGKGGAPEDGLGVPDRKAVLMVSPYNSMHEASAVSVLSMSLSQTSRIPEDARAATTLARALDVQQHVPAAYQLDSILETPQVASMLDSSEEEGCDPQALRLDLTLAYLRRVHLVNFYKGCQRAEFFGDVLAGNEAASTVQYRTIIRPEDEDDGETEPAVVKQEDGADDGAAPKEQNSDEKDEEGNDTAIQTEEEMVKSEPEPPKSPAPPIKDLLVQRLDDAIQHALNVTCHEWIAAADAVVDAKTDGAAEDLRRAEEEAEETWLRHHSIDDEGRARCSFHFCHKLFKDQNFLRKHLKKKHYEYCIAEQAKCHDAYMMKAWEGSGASRPRPMSASLVGPPRLIVPDILVDCGTKYGCLPTPLHHAKKPKSEQQQPNGDDDCEEDTSSDDTAVIVDVVDPEPALWQKEQEQDRIDRERRQAAEEHRQRRREENRQQRGTPSSAPRKDKFVDVDDMQEEEVVTMTFDQVELPQPKKKKKKRKLL
eukprot:scaffold34658_cov230-Amphora_coffeaeformis.AAC.1